MSKIAMLKTVYKTKFTNGKGGAQWRVYILGTHPQKIFFVLFLRL